MTFTVDSDRSPVIMLYRDTTYDELIPGCVMTRSVQYREIIEVAFKLLESKGISYFTCACDDNRKLRGHLEQLVRHVGGRITISESMVEYLIPSTDGDIEIGVPCTGN